MEEIWKDIKGYENKYQVSNLGNVRSLSYNNTNTIKNLVLKINHCGYYEICLTKHNKRKFYLVANLVADAFIKNRTDNTIVTHIDGNKLNNSVDNLKYISKNEVCFFKKDVHEENYKLTYKGKAYVDLKHLASDRNLDYRLIKKRIDNGWDLELAIKLKKQERGKKPLLYDYYGKPKTLEQISKITGISKQLIRKRLERHWNIYEASEIPILRKKEKLYE